MPTDLVLAPVGAGKTERLLDTLVRTVREQPFAPIWVLLPTSRQEDAFRQRLAEQGSRVYFNVNFFNFYTLYARLLDMAGQPQRQLDDTARLRLLRQILTDLKSTGQLPVYGGIADTPGFVRIVADFIYELKQNVIKPEVFSEVAAVGRAKDRDLAQIYSEYQNTLQKNQLVDREGEGWLALDEVERKPKIGREIALLLVDGFDQFNPLQYQLLALLSTRVQQSLITLPLVPERENTVGRRFDEALLKLQMVFERTGHPLQIVPMLNSTDESQSRDSRKRHPALDYFGEKGFVAGAEQRPSDGCLALIEAPDVRQEVGAVLRRVKRLLLTGNCQPDEVLIAVRDWERYGEMIASVARLYDVPVALHYGEKLEHNPAVIALLNLLDLSEQDFRRRDLLDVLRSPYFAIDGLDATQVDLLERISFSQLVTGGRSAWLEAIELAATACPSDEDDKARPLLTVEQASHLRRHLTAFFNGITPPRNAAISDYVRWLEVVIGADVEQDLDERKQVSLLTYPEATAPVMSVHMLRQIRLTTDSEDIVSRDLIAMRELKKVLRSLFAAQNLFAVLGFKQVETPEWWMFLRDLKTALGSAAINRSPNRSGRVLVTTVSDARGLPHRHVFIPGLSEGVFPAPIPEDPLYLDTERRMLTQAGIPLETQAERAADEGLFYELIGLARETLTLSRPTVQNGAFWPESHLWRAVRELYSDSATIIERDQIKLGAVLPVREVASRGEAALAVVDGMDQSGLNTEVASLYNWLISVDDRHWRHIRLVRQIESGRMTNRQFNRYSGRLSQPELLKQVAEALGLGRVWSASQFNDYGMCGFRFFAKRLLKLEKIREPEEGMDAAQLGTLNHAILEKTYGGLAELGITISPDYVEQAVHMLHQSAAEVLENAPREIGFRASALWEQEKVTLLRKLEALVRLDFSEESPVTKLAGDVARYPYRQEVPFSPDDAHMLELTVGDLGTLKVTGYIDRMDRVGDRVIVIDYKTGSTTIPTTEIERGRNFQMILYLLAGQTVLENLREPNAPEAVAGGLFWHLRNQKPSGMISLDNDEDHDIIQKGWEHLSRNIQQGRQGDFATQPNKLEKGACSHYCEYNQFCRISIMNRSRKPR